MTTYTNESLQNIKKKDLIPIISSLQNKLEEVNNSVLVEMRKFNESFSKSQAEVSMTKQVNTLLSSRIVSIERQCWLNAQYSRRECLDIVAISSEVKPDDLGEKVVTIFEQLGCNILTECIDAGHRISKKNPTIIVKFSQRKDCQQVWDAKRNLRKIKMADIDLPGQNKLFINKNLCPYYKVIWAKSKKLHSLGKIHSLFVLGGTIKIRVSENSSPLSLTQVDDFGKYFPDVDLLPPERSD